MIPCYKSIKIVLDKVLALLFIILLSPLFVIIVLFLLAKGNGIFYEQKRIGLLENPFWIYKFKTMKDEIGITDEERITVFGNFLRKYSLDEIPQLLNVLKGDMSFIGPRPLLEEYLPLYSETHRRRHWIMPGLTGLAQVKGRNNLSWKEKFDLDVSYQKSMNFLLDMRILLLTVSYFINGSQGNYPAQKFTGYN